MARVIGPDRMTAEVALLRGLACDRRRRIVLRLLAHRFEPAERLTGWREQPQPSGGVDDVPGLASVTGSEQPIGQVGVGLMEEEAGATVPTVSVSTHRLPHDGIRLTRSDAVESREGEGLYASPLREVSAIVYAESRLSSIAASVL
jgi:hypothetical protein